MRYLFSILAGVSLLGATVISAPVEAQAKKHATTKKAALKYECPMRHYTSSKPGKCPKCGMTLVAVHSQHKTAHSNMNQHTGSGAGNAHSHSAHEKGHK